MMGGNGLTEASHRAVLNANYLKKRIVEADVFDLPYGHGKRMHEFVLAATRLKKERGIRAADVAKRLLDYGYHAPTVYFPLIVDEAIMIEPTETESKETLDRFVEAIVAVAREDPAVVRSAPHNTAVGRLDEVKAAREPRLTYDMTPTKR
jgi:glycine dehydrogenase subunit 2